MSCDDRSAHTGSHDFALQADLKVRAFFDRLTRRAGKNHNHAIVPKMGSLTKSPAALDGDRAGPATRSESPGHCSGALLQARSYVLDLLHVIGHRFVLSSRADFRLIREWEASWWLEETAWTRVICAAL